MEYEEIIAEEGLLHFSKIGFVWLKTCDSSLNILLNYFKWVDSPACDVALIILKDIYGDYLKNQEDDGLEHEDSIISTVQPEQKQSRQLAIITEEMHPRKIASMLGVSRESIYVINREIKRQVNSHLSMLNYARINRKRKKEAVLKYMSEYWSSKIHTLFTWNDVKNYLRSKLVLSQPLVNHNSKVSKRRSWTCVQKDKR